LFQQFQANPVSTLSTTIAGIILLALLYVSDRTLIALKQLLGGTFNIEMLTSPTGSVWYQGFFSRREARCSALETPLAIR